VSVFLFEKTVTTKQQQNQHYYRNFQEQNPGQWHAGYRRTDRQNDYETWPVRIGRLRYMCDVALKRRNLLSRCSVAEGPRDAVLVVHAAGDAHRCKN